MQGDAKPIVKAYVQSVWDRERSRNEEVQAEYAKKIALTAQTGEFELGGAGLRISGVSTHKMDDGAETVFQIGEPLTIRVAWQGKVDSESIYAGYRIDGPRMQAVSGFETQEVDAFLKMSDGVASGVVEFTIPQVELGEGKYTICVSINRRVIPSGPESVVHYVDNACSFNVVRNSPWHFSYLYEPIVSCRFIDPDRSTRDYNGLKK
ncbi:Wzt carbohydrate-binding domain-containing protein [Polaromonas sp.]|uniref:Wzt carbohydrate-binding domain-containing protein n=1 Tax=Polaromonas sp. TaxID=1869339 RepID=UPI003BA8E138